MSLQCVEIITAELSLSISYVVLTDDALCSLISYNWWQCVNE